MQQRKGWVRYSPWLGVLLGLTALVALLWWIDWRQVWHLLRGVPLSLLLVACSLFLAALITRALAWRVLLNTASLGPVFWAVNLGFFLNNVLPLRIGEVGRAWAVHRKLRVPLSLSMASVAVDRLGDMVLLGTIILLTLPFPLPVVWVLFGVVSLLLGGILLRQIRGFVLTRLDRFEQWRRMADLFRFWKDYKVWVRFGIWKTVTWGLLLSMYLLLLRWWVHRLSFKHALWAVSASLLGVAVPSVPGQVGVAEAATVGALTFVGVGAEPAMAFALVNHAIYLLITSILGVVGMFRLGLSWETLRNLKTKSLP